MLPENVSIAAKTLIDYAVGNLAKKINIANDSTSNVSPENAFESMGRALSSLTGGKSKKMMQNAKRKQTRKAKI